MVAHRVVVKSMLPAEGAELMCECGWVMSAPTLGEGHWMAELHEAEGRQRAWTSTPGIALLLVALGSVVVAVLLVAVFGPI